MAESMSLLWSPAVGRRSDMGVKLADVICSRQCYAAALPVLAALLTLTKVCLTSFGVKSATRQACARPWIAGLHLLCRTQSCELP